MSYYLLYSNIIDTNPNIFVIPHLYCSSGPVQNVYIKHDNIITYVQSIGCIVYSVSSILQWKLFCCFLQVTVLLEYIYPNSMLPLFGMLDY